MKIGTLAAIVASASAQPSTCVPMTNQGHGAYYSSSVSVGTPPQRLGVIPDTGSYDLLLDSTYCDGLPCRMHTQFNANISISASNPAGHLAMEHTAYGQGGVDSVAWRDTVRLGSLTAENVDVLLMLDSQLRGYDRPESGFDGIMGLGRRNVTASDITQTALLTSLGVRRFTMCMGSMTGRGGRLELNSGPLEHQFESSFLPATKAARNAWATPMTTASAGEVEINLSAGCMLAQYGACPTIIDSGTTLLAFPRLVHNAIQQGIDRACPGCLEALQQGETCSHRHMSRLPELTFTLGGQEVSLSPSTYMAPMEVCVQAAAAAAAAATLTTHPSPLSPLSPLSLPFPPFSTR